MWFFSLTQKISCFVLIFFIYWLVFPAQTFAAEVLQIRGSKILQIGDHNRNYTVGLACLEVDPSQENEAINVLKIELPRRRKVNLRPINSIDGVLYARVTPLGTDLEISKLLVQKGIGHFTCSSDS